MQRDQWLSIDLWDLISLQNTLRFLRALKRNNDREWFKARKDEYEAHVRAPMVNVIERLAEDFRRFAPELVASPQKSLYRIYRDTRFSENKTPLKTHVAAGFPWRGLPRHEGAGLYFEVAGGWVWAGGGMWAPLPPQLHACPRTHLEHLSGDSAHLAYERVPAQPRRAAGDKLTRVPRGFAKDDPAAEYLKHYRFVAGREFPASLATSAEFYPTLLRTFRALMPLVRFLNEPLIEVPTPADHGSASTARGPHPQRSAAAPLAALPPAPRSAVALATPSFWTSTSATLLTPLSAITRSPSFVGIMLRTTPPPEGMVQV